MLRYQSMGLVGVVRGVVFRGAAAGGRRWWAWWELGAVGLEVREVEVRRGAGARGRVECDAAGREWIEGRGVELFELRTVP